ncbi:hypothetical protein QUC22_04495 [Dehalococcoides mccartyi]
MRDIKFRGKRVSDGKWVYGYYVCVSREGDTPEEAWEAEYESLPYFAEPE